MCSFIATKNRRKGQIKRNKDLFTLVITIFLHPNGYAITFQ